MLTAKQLEQINACARRNGDDDKSNAHFLLKYNDEFSGMSQNRIIELIQAQRKLLNQTANASLAALARSTSAIDAMNKGLIRCGFELEFQSINGKNKHDSSDEIDHERMHDVARESISDEDVLAKMESGLESVARAVMEQMNCDLTYVSTYLDGKLQTQFESDLEASTDAAVDLYVDNMDEDDYRLEGDGMYEDVDLPRELENLISLGEDGSVNGGEIRTVGALTPTQFMKCAQHIMNNNEFEVDSGCSFHIHLSIPGVQHTYGRRFQAELMAYLLERINAMPLAVRERLKSGSANDYFRFKVQSEKYTAVAFRGQTWEFRLFGSIDSAADARRCLILAIDAMRHAYQVKLGLKESLLGTVESESIAELASGVVKEGKTFRAVQKQTRINQNRAS